VRVLFLGSGAFGLPTLMHLVENHEVVGVVSQPDRPAGRKRVLTPTPISAWAEQHLPGAPLRRAEDVNTPDAINQLAGLGAEAAIVIAFGQKLSPTLVDRAAPLVVNLHASLLPKYRGAAPINWAVLEGETTTGVSVISIAQRMDAGRVFATREISIDPLETAGELHDRLAELGPGAIEQVLADLAAGRLQGVAQDEARATRAPKLSKADGRIDFTADAGTLRRRVHGLTPWPGVTVRRVSPAGEVVHELKLLRVRDRIAASPADPGWLSPEGVVRCGDGELELLDVQAPGRKPMSAAEYLRGFPVKVGDRLVGG